MFLLGPPAGVSLEMILPSTPNYYLMTLYHKKYRYFGVLQERYRRFHVLHV